MNLCECCAVLEPTWSSGRLVAYISEKGFRLIDDLEGVVR